MTEQQPNPDLDPRLAAAIKRVARIAARLARRLAEK